MTPRDYLVFYSDAACDTHPTIVRVEHPPCEEPKGSILLDLLCDGLPAGDTIFAGAMQLPNAVWHGGMSLELAVGDGRVASVECTQGAWRVHA